MKDISERILVVLEKNNGLTITELVDRTNFTRSRIRIILAKLEGAKKVNIRKVGMAKLYSSRRKR